MSIKNFQVKNGLSINGVEVIDNNSNANLNSALISGVDILAYTQAAYNQANTGGGSSGADQYARNTANGANGLAAGAYNTANTNATNITYVNEYATSAYEQANVTIGVDATQNTRISEVNQFSAAGYEHANNAYSYANTKFSSAGGTITGDVIVTNDLTVLGNVAFTGNVTSVQVSGNTGSFFGYAANGFNALYAGIPLGYFIEPQTVFNISSNYDGYAAMNMQNINTGQYSSADYFITADNGSITDGFLDLGLAGSTYNYPGYGLLGPNDGYLFVSGKTDTGGGDLILGTQLQNDIVFAVNGLNTENEVMRINSSNNVIIKSTTSSTSNTTGALTVIGGVGISGNVYAGAIRGTKIVPRVLSTSSTSSLTIDADITDQYNLTALSTSLTINSPTGSPVDGQKLIIRFEDNGSSQTLTWTTTSGAFRVVGTTLPTSTTAGKVTYVGCIYNSQDVFWDVIAVTTQV